MESQQQQSQPKETEPASSATTSDERKELRTKREKEWYDYFDKRFGPIVIMILWFFMPVERASFYAPQPDECHALAPHMARIIPKVEEWLEQYFFYPKVVRDLATGSDSIIQIGFITMGYLDRIGVLDKIAPAFNESITRMRAQSESTRFTETVQSNNGTGPIDLSNVYGLGSQWNPS